MPHGLNDKQTQIPHLTGVSRHRPEKSTDWNRNPSSQLHSFPRQQPTRLFAIATTARNLVNINHLTDNSQRFITFRYQKVFTFFSFYNKIIYTFLIAITNNLNTKFSLINLTFLKTNPISLFTQHSLTCNRINKMKLKNSFPYLIYYHTLFPKTPPLLILLLLLPYPLLHYYQQILLHST